MQRRSEKKAPKKKKNLLISSIIFILVIVVGLSVYFYNINNKVDSQIEAPSTNKSAINSSKKTSSHSKKKLSENSTSNASEISTNSSYSNSTSTDRPSGTTSSLSSIYTGNEDRMAAIHNIRKNIAAYALSFVDPNVQQFDPNSYTLTEIPGGFDINFTNGAHVVAMDNKNNTYTFTNENTNQQITQDLGYIMTGKKAPVNN